MELKLERLKYISRLMTHSTQLSISSYESLRLPDIFRNLNMMLAPPHLTEDLYLCDTSQSQRATEDVIKEIYLKLLSHSSEVSMSSSKEVGKLERKLEELAVYSLAKSDEEETCHDAELNVELHLRYIEYFLRHPLPSGFTALDCNHGWMLYWLLNAYALIQDGAIPEDLKFSVSLKISLLVIDEGRGGIAGGPHGQIGHAASTYASVLALILVEDYSQLDGIKQNLYHWFLSLKNANGSFAMHEGGESDARSTYCVLSVAALLNILTEELMQGTTEFLVSCQTYEGGFAGTPFTEAHGGYTFCALAALYLTPAKLDGIHMDTLLRWLGERQLQLEGGFSGRSNKLVDACYSFWIGSSFTLAESFLGTQSLFNRSALKTYILNCCQDEAYGGLRDKPGKNADFYHTNYTLCGYSVAEHLYAPDGQFNFKSTEVFEGSTVTVDVNPLFGLPIDLVSKCYKYFNPS